ncbi:MAG: 7-cyano-7-deazaguanine synthase QueC [Parachlamydiaceae bacterium]|nr:7-cyano-7-deazaguanine synthase QueC [Parachlamydiaceae bacterium]
MKKNAVVIHSGGMDSSICLALAIREFGADKVLSLSFEYSQRHPPELIQAAKICKDWKVDHVQLEIDCLKEITSSALIGSNIPIHHETNKPPNTLVVGRNGLMAHLGGIHAHHLGAHCIYMGVMELEGANCGYRDCSRKYMDLQQEILRIDLDMPKFEIRTPVIRCTKKETMDMAHELGILPYLLEETITCYEGIRKKGCGACPSCKLRNQGIADYVKANPDCRMPY